MKLLLEFGVIKREIVVSVQRAWEACHYVG